jgi:hypothetical protein
MEFCGAFAPDRREAKVAGNRRAQRRLTAHRHFPNRLAPLLDALLPPQLRSHPLPAAASGGLAAFFLVAAAGNAREQHSLMVAI